MNSEIFVITHKKVFVNLPEGYIPIQVGNANLDTQYLRDNTLDNISNKNSNYCELTAIYWLWKNYELPDYIGITHYRRFFVNGLFHKFIEIKDVEQLMKNCDVILPYPQKMNTTVKEHFINSPSGRKEDIDRLENLIKNNYQDYYNDFIKVMNSNEMSYYNMMIIDKENYKKYCEWLFDLLFEYEKTTNLDGYSKEEQRIYGFLSEFLLNVWISKNKLKINYLDMTIINESKFKNFIKNLKITGRVILRKIRG